MYGAILRAVETLPETQVVLSVGRSVDVDQLGTIPSTVIVVRSVPQIELLKRTSLTITHAGLNTALESLAQGVPMIAIPIGYNQPGVAARIAHHGVGKFVAVEDLDADRLRALIQRVLTISSYGERARYFRDVIAQARGLDVAADVIEHALGATGGAPSASTTGRTRRAPLSGKSACQEPAARNVA